MNDPYKILGVEKGAEESVVKSAYRKLVNQWHPDRHRAATSEQQKQAEDKFKEITEAYERITKPSANNREAPGYSSYGNFDNFDDVLRNFETMFGGSFRREYAPPPSNVSYLLTLEEAFTGKNAEIKVQFHDGTVRTVNVNIPEGADTGWRLRVAGQGPTVQGRPSDLNVNIRVAPHDRFQRDNEHLICVVDLDPFDAMLGKNIDILTIDRKTLSVRIPAGTQPNTTMRVGNFGMPIPGMPHLGDTPQRGELYLQIKVNIPKLTEEQSEKLRNFRNQL